MPFAFQVCSYKVWKVGYDDQYKCPKKRLRLKNVQFILQRK